MAGAGLPLIGGCYGSCCAERQLGCRTPWLFELELLVAVPGGHVGNDDVVAGEQALRNLDAVVGGAAQHDLHAAGFLTVIGNFKERKRRAGFGLQRPFDESGEGNLVHFDGTGGGKIGASFPGLRTKELEINAHGAVLHVGIDMGNLGGIGVVLQSDVARLVDLNAAGLRFGNVNLGHEASGIGDASEDGAGANLLAYTDGEFFHDAAHTGANHERFFLLGAQGVERLHLRDFRLLGGELSLTSFGRNTDTFAFNLQTSGEGIGLGARNFRVHGGAELSLQQGVIAFGFELGLRSVGLELSFQSFLIEQLRLKLNTQVGKFGFGFFHGELGVGDLAIEIGIAELKNEGVRFYVGAGKKKNLINTALSASGEPPHIFRNEGTKPINAAGHGTRFHGNELQRSFVDSGGGRTKTKNSKRDGQT